MTDASHPSVGWLLERCREHGDAEAVVHDRGEASDRATYAELLAATEDWRRRLAERDLAPGTPVALVADFTPAACAAMLALIDRAAIVVPLMPATHATHPEFLDIARCRLVVFPDDARVEPHAPAEADHDLLTDLRSRNEPGLVLFSSGSTGTPKAALHAFGPLLDKFRTRRPPWRTLTFLLLDHIGGINTLFHTLANGGTAIATADRSPEAVAAVVARQRVALLPVSPTFINLLLLSEAYTRHDLSSLKVITYGTEPMPQSTLDRLADTFPDLKLQQTYGLSEVGIFRSKSEGPRSLWVKIGGEGFETRIVDGVLHVRSRSSILGYLNHPSPFDDEGWMNTGDEVEVRGEYVRFKGRRKEIINVGGEKVYPIEVESALLALDNIRDAIVFAESSPLLGQLVVAQVQLEADEPAADLRRRVRRELKGTLAPFKVPQKIIVSDVDAFNERYKRMRLRRRQ